MLATSMIREPVAVGEKRCHKWGNALGPKKTINREPDSFKRAESEPRRGRNELGGREARESSRKWRRRAWWGAVGKCRHHQRRLDWGESPKALNGDSLPRPSGSPSALHLRGLHHQPLGSLLAPVEASSRSSVEWDRRRRRPEYLLLWLPPCWARSGSAYFLCRRPHSESSSQPSPRAPGSSVTLPPVPSVLGLVAAAHHG